MEINALAPAPPPPPEEPPLLLPPVLEGQMPPGLCRPQLLAVLVESGVLRPGQITVGTAES